MRRYLIAFLLALPLGAVAEIREVPPYAYVPEKAVVQPELLGDARTPTRTLALTGSVEQEMLALKAENQASGKERPIKIGFGRDLGELGLIELAALRWADVEGGKASRIQVTSAGAAALRLAIALEGAPEELSLRFKGSARDQVFGPVSGGEISRLGQYWSDVLEGESGLIELFLPGDAKIAGGALHIGQLSHLIVAGANLLPDRVKTVSDIGRADSCNYDVACVSNPSAALLNASKAVAQLVFSSGSTTYLCTGTMLNSVYSNGAPTGNPYLYTAYHCIGNQSEASTLNTYWFFEAATCDSLAVPSGYQIVGGGATLLYAVFNTDVSFMRLNGTPPSGAYFAGWNANQVASGTAAMTLHHPAGDLKKFTQGTTQGYGLYGEGRTANYITIRYSHGSTQGGSSGAGIFTYNASGYYQLQGGLLGGDASCTNMSGLDYYSPMDTAYSSLAQWLTPSSGGGSSLTVWEFYNSILNHYFITAAQGEASGIDSGAAGPGWSRTGYTFGAYTLNGGSGAPVCRFYGPSPINSHFYTVNASECAYVQTIGGWQLEGHVFNIGSPSGQSCGSGTVPVYRAYNNGFVTGAGSNHRYTTSYSVYQSMLSAGWLAEGVVFCAPQ